ncbi:MAG: RNA 2'-phosphotransferase [Myxococcales bacterium]|nr:RNA 2'-phosphotransferase [Myxococcales bacterium]
MSDSAHISKTLSFWLRHRPDAAGIELDAQGWASTDDILRALGKDHSTFDLDQLLDVVEANDKRRFELSADLDRIRARQGHSVEVDLELQPSPPPAVLYHGTPERFVDTISAEGLRRMARHHVHLSSDALTARKVGARRGRPVVLVIDAASMVDAGHTFYVTSNGVWLTESVPPRFLRVAS